LWCSRVDDACVFLDDAGYAFAPAPLLKGSALGRYVTTDIIPAVATMAPFADVLPQVEAWLAEIERVTPLAAEKIEIDAMRDVYVTVAGGGELKFSLNDDLERVLENLTSILASEAFMDIAPGTFRYIDLRFGNKVFVNTELVTTATSTALTSDDAAATGTVLTTMVEDIAASVAEVTESTLELVGTTTASTTE
jgi:hypothetical protein